MLPFILLFTAITLGAFFLSGSLAPATEGVGSRVAQLEVTHTPRKRLGIGLRRLGSLIEPWVKGLAIAKSLDRELYRVGWAWSASEFLVACALLAVASGLFSAVLLQRLWLAPIVGAVGGAIPFLQLHLKRQKILKALNEQLPDALMLIINGVRAGNSFLQALQLVSRQMSGAIAQEFATTVSEINWGLSVETALSNLSERIGSVDIELAVAAMLVQREAGGNLTETLTNIHDTIRERVRISGEVHALTAQGRLSGIVLVCLPVGVGFLFSLVSPGYIGPLFTDPRGQMLVGLAVVLQALGIYFIRRVVAIRF
jgi:tight adherence protein B